MFINTDTFGIRPDLEPTASGEVESAPAQLLVSMLTLAVSDCNEILNGKPGRAPSKGEVVNALSAVKFLRSKWGQGLLREFMGAEGQAVALSLSDRAISAMGITPSFIDGITEGQLFAAVGSYGNQTTRLPEAAQRALQQSAFRFAA